MVLVLAFAATLLLAVLVSARAERTILSTSVLFLVAGFLLGQSRLGGQVADSPGRSLVERTAELALFTILFTDGMRCGIRDLSSAWRLPGRALLLGLPLTLAGTAVLAHLLVGAPWMGAFLLGAALSPTDPVFAAAIVGREEVPARLRHLLNVESGLNDGLALPIVMMLLALLRSHDVAVPVLLAEVGAGVALGVAVPWIAVALEKSRLFGAAPLYKPLGVVAIAMLLLSISSLTHANEFLAAFAGGVTLVSVAPRAREVFQEVGEAAGEIFKLAALFLFGALVSHDLLAGVGARGLAFAALALVAVRPAALAIALIGGGLDRREWVAAAWFGPKGFASVVYGLLILRSGAPRADEMFHLIALVVAGSIVAHSSTDVLVARWFRREEPE
ncbi:MULTISPECIES: cation:proton antiporter [Sorangium]|uniref:Peptidase n=1 Tax=Sorangium cellulosum TaxID=56 RepID=A0A4P2QSP6_SORCE|nr:MULTISPECIES: cation:proton antiporter [Sorangium]AUX33076.1 peptidase [Sorangium cellulosum]WCQ92451.1 K(+)/H(+) antiporter NhaP [Sorangium sp. Soce836]